MSAAWLRDAMHDGTVVTLDATWYMQPSSKPSQYEAIPGARVWDLDSTSDPNEAHGRPHMLPGNDSFTEVGLGASRLLLH